MRSLIKPQNPNQSLSHEFSMESAVVPVGLMFKDLEHLQSHFNRVPVGLLVSGVLHI
jgi:hypothetical protein